MKISAFITTMLSMLIFLQQGFAQSYSLSASTADITVAATLPTIVYNTAPTDGSSDVNYPAITHQFTGNLDFTFNADNTVNFTGNLNLGDYETQTNVDGFIKIDGHQTFVGANHAISGIGTYDPTTHTVTYTLASNGSNSNGGSVQTQTSASCQNGNTSIFATVCETWSSTTAHWEGLTLNLVFTPDHSMMGGTIVATEQSGSGLTASTTTITFNVSGS